MNNKVTITFEYKGKEYIHTVVSDKDEDIIRFWWEDGNGGCDCNRSIFLHRSYPDLEVFKEEFKCGDEIKLVNLSIN